MESSRRKLSAADNDTVSEPPIVIASWRDTEQLPGPDARRSRGDRTSFWHFLIEVF